MSQCKLPETKYYPIDLGHKTVNIRKWKAKDRNAFKKLAQSETEDLEKKILDVLVWKCIEDKNVALSFDELQYLFIKIRELSISDSFVFSYKCKKCGNTNTSTLKIKDAIKFTYSEFKPVENIEFQSPPNPAFYNKMLRSPDYDESYELALHTKSIDGDVTMDFKEIVEYYENLDTDEYDRIVDEFNKMVFKLKTTKTFTCKHKIDDKICGEKLTVEFDEIPDFFPESWLKY